MMGGYKWGRGGLKLAHMHINNGGGAGKSCSSFFSKLCWITQDCAKKYRVKVNKMAVAGIHARSETCNVDMKH